MEILNSKNISFKLDENINDSNNKQLLLTENKKRTTYKFINNSNDIMSTKNSIRMSRPSIQSFGFDKNKNIQNINLNRIDAFGNKISKGDKDYKVSFIDQISSEKIAEVIFINTYHKKTINENKAYICCNSCFIF